MTHHVLAHTVASAASLVGTLSVIRALENAADTGNHQAEAQHSRAIESALAAPEVSQDDRAEKVRILLDQVMPSSWRGDDDVLEWEVAMARRLLLAWAGLDPMKDPLA